MKSEVSSFKVSRLTDLLQVAKGLLDRGNVESAGRVLENGVKLIKGMEKTFTRLATQLAEMRLEHGRLAEVDATQLKTLQIHVYKALRQENKCDDAKSFLSQVGLALPELQQAWEGRAVLSHWLKWQFFKASICSVNREDGTFTVNFEDGDVTHRVQPFDLVYPDDVPDEEDLTVGTVVLFPQGSYCAGSGNTGGVFWHQGVITRIDVTPSAPTLYSGHHTKGEADGKRMLRSYVYEFHDLTANDLRVAAKMT